MGSSLMGLLVFVTFGGLVSSLSESPSYNQNYEIVWESNHVLTLHQGREVQISMDNSSGSAIGSKLTYDSGYFHLRIKLPGGDSAGVVTAFYLSSHTDNHDELDFEFLGNREGKPFFLQTNVFVNGQGNREQRILLWFDPTASFHTYRILWNIHQIVFFVDDTPIRVFQNKKDTGVSYPSQPMQLLASIWDGDNWATDGGQTKTDWSQAPFTAYLRSFSIDGCPSNNNPQICYSSKFWWNREKFCSLSSSQQEAYQNVRNNYLTYDYCDDKKRFPIPPSECPQ